MKTRSDLCSRTSLHLAIPDSGYEALQSMITGEYNEESTGARTIRQTGGKDRHSKVFTSRGPRDRRVRLSVSTAIRFYDLQDRLGFEQPSKAVEWLLLHCQPSIKALPQLGSLRRPCFGPRRPLSQSSNPSPIIPPPAFSLCKTPHVKPSSKNIPQIPHSIGSHSRYAQDNHLHHQTPELPTLKLANQTAPTWCLQLDSPRVLDTYSVSAAYAKKNIPEEGDRPRSSHPSSSAGSSSNPTASLSTKILPQHLDEAALGNQSYSLNLAFNSSGTQIPHWSKKRRMLASQYFSAALDHSKTDNFSSIMSDVNGSITNFDTLPANVKCFSTQPIIEGLLGTQAFYDEFSANLSSDSGAIYDELLPPAKQSATSSSIFRAADLVSLCGTAMGRSLQGIEPDMNAMQAVMTERLKADSTADQNMCKAHLPPFQPQRMNTANASLVSRDFKGAQVQQSLITLNPSVADDVMEIYRRSGTNEMNILSPSESNDTISNNGIVPIINGSNNYNNSYQANANYYGDSATNCTGISGSQF